MNSRRTPHITAGAGARGALGGLGRPPSWARRRTPSWSPIQASKRPAFIDETRKSLQQSLAPVGALFRLFRRSHHRANGRGRGLARESGAGVIVALGGGSALDLGKAVAAIARREAPALAV